MEEKLKKEDAGNQQELEQKLKYYKRLAKFLGGFLALLLLCNYLGCDDCYRGNNGGYEDRIVNSVDNAIDDVMKEKKSIDGMKVDETKTHFGDSIGLYRKGKKWGFYNLNTEKVLVRNSVGVPAEYDYVWFFAEGLAAVVQDGKIGFIDMEGQVQIPYQFLYRTNNNRTIVFRNGYCAMAGRDEHLGVINQKGKWVIPPIYEGLSLTPSCIYASTSTSRIKLNYWGEVMQKDMIVKVEPLKCSDHPTGYNVYYVFDGMDRERCGVMDHTGKRLTEPVYRRVEALSDELFKCYFLDGKTMEVLHFPAIKKEQ